MPAVRHPDPPGRVHEPVRVFLPSLPAPPTAAGKGSLTCKITQLDLIPAGWDH